MTHVLMVAMDFPPVMGGISAHVYELSRHMALSGVQVTVLARAVGGAMPIDPEIPGLTVIPYTLKWAAPFYGWQLRREILKTCRMVNPDLVHIHGLGPLDRYKASAAPMVYTNHTSGYLKKIEKESQRHLRQLRRFFKPVDLFLAPSEELLETPFDIAAPKKYIPNGIDTEKFKRDAAVRQRIREKLNLGPGDILGIVTRRMVEKNGLVHLANACGKIKNEAVRFLFIGDGDTRPEVESILDAHFAGRFNMTGALTHDEIIQYYHGADFSVLPSLMEATSISGLEAMAAGLPLVGTRVGGIPDLIDDGITGFLCEPADPSDLAAKIDRLVSADYQKMGQAGLQKVLDSFDWSRIVQRTLKAYKENL